MRKKEQFFYSLRYSLVFKSSYCHPSWHITRKYMLLGIALIKFLMFKIMSSIVHIFNLPAGMQVVVSKPPWKIKWFLEYRRVALLRQRQFNDGVLVLVNYNFFPGTFLTLSLVWWRDIAIAWGGFLLFKPLFHVDGPRLLLWLVARRYWGDKCLMFNINSKVCLLK